MGREKGKRREEKKNGKLQLQNYEAISFADKIFFHAYPGFD